MRYKFRAWDINNKKMFRVDRIDYRNDNFEIREVRRATEYPINVADQMYYDLLEIELMQFTGLTDVNGREIYEGDIVKAWNRGVCGTFQVKWRSDGVPMYILFPAWQKGKSWHLYNNGSGIDGGIEVIGNVFENPELLKEKN